MGEIYKQMSKSLRKGAVDDPKRKLVTVSEAEREKRFAKIFKPFHEKWIKSNPDGQKKYDTLMKILADIRKGQ